VANPLWRSMSGAATTQPMQLLTLLQPQVVTRIALLQPQFAVRTHLHPPHAAPLDLWMPPRRLRHGQMDVSVGIRYM
jgi:hypothetical protein